MAANTSGFDTVCLARHKIPDAADEGSIYRHYTQMIASAPPVAPASTLGSTTG